MFRPVFHLILHFLIPGVTAQIFFKQKRLTAWLIMISTMLIDLDHLLATPIYQAGRCSIGFHPLHSWAAIGGYMLLFGFSRTRLIALGLMIHIGLDYIDCIWMRWE